MAASQTYFVTGASGSQGRYVAHKLLASGHKVRALVRDPNKPASVELHKLGAMLISGDYDNIPAVQEAAQGCTGIFLLPMPSQNPGGELKQVQNIIATSKAAGIKRIVISTVARAEEGEKFAKLVPGNKHFSSYWPSKKAVQEAVQNAGFESWTILQPGWLMTNWIMPVSQFYFAELKKEKVIVMSVAEDTVLDLTAPEDIGSFAAKALSEEESGLENRIIKVAGERLTVGECADVISQVSGTKVGFRIKSDEDIEKEKNASPLVASQIWGKLEGSKIDLEQVKSYGVPLTTFKQFLENHKEQILAAVEG